MKEIITPKDFEFLKTEIQNLKLKIKKLSKELGEAAKHSGSFVTHNPEYESISDEIKPLKERVRSYEELQGKLSVIELKNIGSKDISPYSLVTIEELDTGKLQKYYILYPFLVDSHRNYEDLVIVSPESPIGKALEGKKKNDLVDIVLPNRTKKVKIVDYKFIDQGKLDS